MSDIVVNNFKNGGDAPRVFIDESTRSIVNLTSIIIGRGVYKPGWRWSKDAGSQTGKPSARHIGWIESGNMLIRAANGEEVTLGAGDFFEVGPGHDAWVIGDAPCIALDFEAKGLAKRQLSGNSG